MTRLEHHAQLVVGKADSLIAELKKVYGFCRHYHFSNLSIENSRALKNEQSLGSDTKKIFILEIASATTEAQNALLKVLEEPAADTYFFFIVPSAEILLPTVRSRLQTLKATSPPTPPQRGGELAQDFLAMTPAKRLEWLKTAEIPANFLDQIEVALNESARAALDPRATLAGYPDLTLARRHWHTPGVTHKLFLEHLAVVFPQTNDK